MPQLNEFSWMNLYLLFLLSFMFSIMFAFSLGLKSTKLFESFKVNHFSSII